MAQVYETFIINNKLHHAPLRWLLLKSLQVSNAAEDVEEREPPYTVGGIVSWYSHYGKHYGAS